jgi:ribosomal protein S18 acetylase RimI-like enzyme
MGEIDFNIRPAEISDRSRLANLIHFGSHIHQHLDWKSALDWIGSIPYQLLEKNGSLVAALACPPELPEITWIRLFASSNNISADHAWKYLWESAIDKLIGIPVKAVAALSLQSWFNELLEASDFVQTDNVIVLMTDFASSIPKPSESNVKLRPMVLEDLPIVADIDNTSFNFEWRNSIDSLDLAYHQCSHATIAEIDDRIVGYQYSTSSVMGGHLARLAVRSDMQGKGIGYLLVHDVIHYFSLQGLRHVTVNTQQSNHASIALYSRAGFKSTGESYRVYQYKIVD